jgi:uncharacterized RDD family membrane protein YckC
MKCPKCHYISFDEVDRCRNCGYDFRLVQERTEGPELSLRDPAPPIGPPDDLPLAHATMTPAGVEPRPVRSIAATPPGGELPLFDAPVRGVDDTPLLTVPAPPRAPLAVRRSTIDATKPEGSRAEPAPAAGAGRPHRREPPPADVASRRGVPDAGARREPDALPPSASWARLGAAVLDAAILGGIDLAVAFFTLRLTGLTFAQVGQLSLVPLAAFLLLLDGGYLVGFTTASGQTIGKMLTGVRVVADTTQRVPLGSAVARTAAMLLTVLSLGVGYVPALAGRDRRALHDRLSGTRVVRR